ncbi:MAG: hypothetical protein D6753_18270, partial [Planctomycetota bacterium]
MEDIVQALPRWKKIWLAIAFGSTALVGTIVGTLMIAAPDLSRKILGFPGELPNTDPVVYGVLAAIWIAVGLQCFPALFKPTAYLPMLKIQLVYKAIWIAAIAAPLLRQGKFPDYAWTLLVGNCVWIGFDVLAIPWRPPAVPQAVRRHPRRVQSSPSTV